PRSHRRQASCPSLSRVRSSGGHYFNHLSFEKEPAMLWPFRRTTVRPTNPHRFRPGVLALESRWVPSAITEFQLPPLTNGAHIGAAGITAGPDGNVWFTDPVQSEVGRISPSGQVTEFPTTGNPAGAITAGPDGNLWFVGNFVGGRVGRITPDGQ